MLPPSITIWWPSFIASNNRIRRARATLPGIALSYFQSGYFAQALKRQFTIATSDPPLFVRTKLGPESGVHPLLVMNRKNWILEASTPVRARTRRAEAS